MMQYEIRPPKLALDTSSMDAAHRDLLNDLMHLSNLPDKEFAENFSAWVAKAETDFYAEEQLMEEINFPDIRSHLEQHARVLSALHHAEPRVMEGDITVGREVIALLPQWFETHISTMDQVLVTALRMSREEKNPPMHAPPSSST